MKHCPKCKQDKLLSEFSKDRTTKDGLQGWCKSCRADYQRTPAGKAAQGRAIKKRYSTVRGHLQSIFSGMKQRCTDPENKDYKRYGSRGIKVLFTSSEEFIDYVENVLKVDPRGLTIDRIDNSGNYERGNIRFVTNLENQRNK